MVEKGPESGEEGEADGFWRVGKESEERGEDGRLDKRGGEEPVLGERGSGVNGSNDNFVPFVAQERDEFRDDDDTCILSPQSTSESAELEPHSPPYLVVCVLAQEHSLLCQPADVYPTRISRESAVETTCENPHIQMAGNL